jgi:hypothetical protein
VIFNNILRYFFTFCFGTTEKVIQIGVDSEVRGKKSHSHRKSQLLRVEGLDEEASEQLKLGFGLNFGLFCTALYVAFD